MELVGRRTSEQTLFPFSNPRDRGESERKEERKLRNCEREEKFFFPERVREGFFSPRVYVRSMEKWVAYEKEENVVDNRRREIEHGRAYVCACERE